MSIRPIRHFAPVRGASDTLTFINKYAVVLSEPVPAGTIAVPVTKIRVVSVPTTIPTGYELAFMSTSGSCTIYRMIVSSTASAGDSVINVSPYIGPKIACEWFSFCGFEDLSNRVYRAQVKKNLADTVPYLTLSCTTIPTQGTIQVTCLTTGAEDTNATFRQLPTDESELQLINEKDKDTGALIRTHYKKIIESAWVWDLEYSFQGGAPIPDTVGLFWLQAEATV
jgi:hypothetical protein